MAALIFIFLCVLLEAIFRLPAVQNYFPFQAYGINHIQFEYQLKRLAAFVEEHGKPDCFILGTSQSLRGIDPEVLNPDIQQLSGENLTCFNFSIVGVNLSTNLLFAEILQREYAPRLFILGTSFLDLTETRESRYDPRFEESAWVEYMRGKLNLQGWLIDQSYAYRALLYFSYAAPNFMDFSELHDEERKWNYQLTEYGYGYSDHAIDPSQPLSSVFINNFLEQFGSFQLSTWNLLSLEQIAEFSREHHIALVLVIMPYHPALIELRGEDGNSHPAREPLQDFIQRAHQALQEIAERHNLPLWYAPSASAYPSIGWHDLYHLNAKASPTLSHWLAAQIAEALGQGNLTLEQAGLK